MGDIEPEGLPAVKLDPLLSMISKNNLIRREIWLVFKRETY